MSDADVVRRCDEILSRPIGHCACGAEIEVMQFCFGCRRFVCDACARSKGRTSREHKAEEHGVSDR